MSHQLKIKYTSLAAEVTLIHKEEIRCKRRARKLGRRTGKLCAASPERLARLAEKGLPVQGQAIWTEENRSEFWSLRGHRYELKEELRSTALARAFIKGFTYRQIERTNNRLKSGPNAFRIARLVAKYGNKETLQIDPKWDRDEAEEFVLEMFIKPWLSEPEVEMKEAAKAAA